MYRIRARFSKVHRSETIYSSTFSKEILHLVCLKPIDDHLCILSYVHVGLPTSAAAPGLTSLKRRFSPIATSISLRHRSSVGRLFVDDAYVGIEFRRKISQWPGAWGGVYPGYRSGWIS